MAGEVGQPPKVGQGFFDSQGNLKTKEVLQRDNSQVSNEKSNAASSEGVSLDSALRQVGNQFRDRANQAVSSLNEKTDNVRQAKELVNEEIETAKAIKQALKDGDQEAVEENTAKFAELEKKRSDLAKSIESDNRRLSETETVLNLGNKILGTARNSDVSFKSKAQPELDSAEGVQRTIDSLQSERDELKSQQTSLKDARSDIKEVIKQGEAELGKIQEDSIRTIESAQDEANNLASRIRGAGAQSVLAQNINSTVVQSLLS